jgi:DNA polymerase-1
LHYIGDRCAPDGHVDHLLAWIAGEIDDVAYNALFRTHIKIEEIVKPQIEHVRDTERSDQFIEWLLSTQDEYLAVDTETTGLDVWHDRIRMVQFGDRTHGWAIPYEDNPDGQDLVDRALKFLASEGRPVSAHRMKFDSLFLQNAGHNVDAIAEDGKASAHLINATRSGLKEAAAHAFGPWVLEGEQRLIEAAKTGGYLAKAAKRMTGSAFSAVPLDMYEYWFYGGMDPVLEARLQAHNEPEIAAKYMDLYELELDVSQALQQAETAGLTVDLDYCQREYDSLTKQIDEEQTKWDAAEINIRSTQQLVPLFEEAGFAPPTTEKGNPSIDDKWLESLPSHPMIDSLRRLRHLYKQRDTYFKAYLEKQVDGKIHTFIDTLGARTGRMSSRDPNLQNVPKREDGDYIRQAFTATPGHILVLADYEQIEYRIFASAAGEPDMIQAILDGEDMHAVTARMVYGDPSITKADPRRDLAKNGNFAEIFLAGLPKFASTAGVSLEVAESFKTAYHRTFRKVKPFQKAVMNYARLNNGFILTRFGRKVPVDANQIYAAINYLIQGSAADVLKRAIQRIARTMWGQYLRLPVHDELIFEVPIELADQLCRELPELMEDRDTFRVPLEIEISRAYRWGVKLQKEAA